MFFLTYQLLQTMCCLLYSVYCICLKYLSNTEYSETANDIFNVYKYIYLYTCDIVYQIVET